MPIPSLWPSLPTTVNTNKDLGHHYDWIPSVSHRSWVDKSEDFQLKCFQKYVITKICGPRVFFSSHVRDKDSHAVHLPSFRKRCWDIYEGEKKTLVAYARVNTSQNEWISR